MTQSNDLSAARAALKAADDETIANIVAKLDGALNDAKAATMETAEGDKTLTVIKNHINALRATLTKTHGVP